MFHASVFQKRMLWSNGKKQKRFLWVHNSIKQLSVIFPQLDSYSWKFQKMHLQLHITQYIEIYNGPLNFDCLNGEHALQEFAKDLSKSVTKNTTIHEFNYNLAKLLQQHQIQLHYIIEYSMTNRPFFKIVFSFEAQSYISK